MKETGTIGIVGGGQLGRMLTLAALPLGFRVIVLDPGENAPAAQAGAEQIVGGLQDEAAIHRLARRADHVTIEIEHVDADTLDVLEKAGKQVNPSAQTIRLIQDKYVQKRWLRENNLPVGDFTEITDEATAVKLVKQWREMIVKTRRGAYDGRGNMIVKNEREVKAALKKFGGRPLYAEKLVPFVKELSVVVARSVSGEVKLYPVVETIHERNICLEVLSPADISDRARTAATRIARSVAGLLNGAGVFAIEMFLTSSGEVLINEIAPRVHNSGHHTLDASHTSQFEQHVRAITGLPLGSTDQLVPAAVMINILGERDGPVDLAGLDETLATPHTSVHLYGKSPTKVDRKMGHITATGQTLTQARRRARAARRKLSI